MLYRSCHYQWQMQSYMLVHCKRHPSKSTLKDWPEYPIYSLLTKLLSMCHPQHGSIITVVWHKATQYFSSVLESKFKLLNTWCVQLWRLISKISKISFELYVSMFQFATDALLNAPQYSRPNFNFLKSRQNWRSEQFSWLSVAYYKLSS